MGDRIQNTLSRLKSRFIRTENRDPSVEEALLSADEPTIIDRPPTDRFYLVYAIFTIHGLSMLLPWNVFITASDYFSFKFAGSTYEQTFQNYFSTYFTLSSLISFTLALWQQKNANINVRIVSSILVNLISFAFIALTVHKQWNPETYFYIIMLLLVSTAASVSYFQISVFAMASILPGQHIQGVMSGQGLAGIGVAVVSILSVLAASNKKFNGSLLSEEIEDSAFLYFLSAMLLTLLSLIGHFIMVRLKYFTYFFKASPLPNSSIDDSDADPNVIKNYPTIFEILRKIRLLAIAIALVFIVTLSVFPSLTALIKSISDSQTPTSAALFTSTHFLLFNIFDWVGRTFPLIYTILNPAWILIFSCLRIIFIPLFMLCNLPDLQPPKTFPTLITSDWVYFAILCAFAFSNGYISSVAMIAAPIQRQIEGPNEKELAGSVMVYLLVLGLAIGGTFSWVVRAFI